MQTVDTIINARWVVPIIPENTILENYSVVINEGSIVAVMPTADVTEKYVSDNVIDRPDHVIMPGLINMHAHAAMSLFKAYSDDKSLMDWLQKDIWPAEGAFVGPEFCIDGTKLAAAEMIRSGTTCYNDMYFAIYDAVETTVSIGIRTCHGLGVFGFPTSWGSGPEECLRKNRELLEKQQFKHELVTYSVAPHAPYTVPEAVLVQSKALCDDFHISYEVLTNTETKEELTASIAGDKSSSSCHLSAEHCSPIKNMARLDLLHNTICAHCVHVTDEDIILLAQHGASVVHNPTSNLKLASGLCPVQKMLDGGVNVCLGTDSACSNNNLDMFSEMRNAALIGKVAAGSAQACTATTCLQMATINGAKALGLEKEIGSVEVGKKADLIAVNLNQVETWPLSNILSHLVYAVGRDQVTDSWVNGHMLMNGRHLTTINENQLPNIAKKWENTLRKFKSQQN